VLDDSSLVLDARSDMSLTVVYVMLEDALVSNKTEIVRVVSTITFLNLLNVSVLYILVRHLRVFRVMDLLLDFSSKLVSFSELVSVWFIMELIAHNAKDLDTPILL